MIWKKRKRTGSQDTLRKAHEINLQSSICRGNNFFLDGKLFQRFFTGLKEHVKIKREEEDKSLKVPFGDFSGVGKLAFDPCIR